jgi:transketolase
MVVINPSDAVEARCAVEAAIKHEGPVYMRFGRLAVSVINDKPDYKFEIGKGITLVDGSDITIVATGIMVEQALLASEMLASEGISAGVVNIHTIKPLDTQLLIALAQQTGAMVVTEEHSVIGGLGSAVCEALAGVCPIPVVRHGIEDVYGKSAPAKELLEYYKLNALGIVEKAKQALAMKH